MKKHIVCFGDSNTHGYDAENPCVRFNEEQRWTCLLQKKLGDEYLVLEEGLGGRTVCLEDPYGEGMSGMEAIYPCLLTHEPVDLLIIMLGTNDTKERFGVTAECIAYGLRRLVGKATAAVDCWTDRKANILIVTPQNIGREYVNADVYPLMGRGCAEKSEKLGKEFEKVAKSTGCSYMDANEILTVGPNTYDYMHLTEEAHKQLAEALAERIIDIL